MENEVVAIYQTWFESVGLLGREKQIEAMMMIIRYGLYGEKPDYGDDVTLEAVMMTWLAQVDAQKKKRKGGAPKGNQNAKGNKGGTGRPKKTQPENTTLNKNENENINKNSRSTDDAPAVGGAGATSLNDDEPEWMMEEYDGS